MTETATTRPMPWDVMGKALAPTHKTNLTKALKAAKMDYTVEVWDTLATRDLGEGRETIRNPKGRQIVRPIAGVPTVVGQTGTRFTPRQNADAFAIAHPLIESGATITGLADFRSGASSLLVMDLGRSIVLTTPDGGEDVVDLNLMVRNVHDGSGALKFAFNPMRFACTNAVPAFIKGAVRTWNVSHTPNAEARQEEAHEAILKALEYREAYQAVAQSMMDQPMVDAEFAKIVGDLWKVSPDAEGAVADRKREVQAQVVNLYASSPTLEHVRGTAWGGFNALTEYLDHFRPVKGDEDVARAEGALEGPYVRRKLALFSKFAGV